MKIKGAHGTPEQLESLVKNRISELGGQSVNSASSGDTQESYIHNLIEDIDAELGHVFDSLTFDTKDNALIITTVLDSEVNEFTVPYSDIKFNNIDRDVQFICNEVEEECNREYVDECTDIKAASATSSVYNAVVNALKRTRVDVNAEETKKYIDKAMPTVLGEYNGDAEAWFEYVMQGYKVTGDYSSVMEVLDLPHVPYDQLDYSEFPDNSELADAIGQEVSSKLESVGVDVDTPEAQYYMDGAVDFILQDDDHDVEMWWNETLANYRDEIDELPHVGE